MSNAKTDIYICATSYALLMEVRTTEGIECDNFELNEWLSVPLNEDEGVRTSRVAEFVEFLIKRPATDELVAIEQMVVLPGRNGLYQNVLDNIYRAEYADSTMLVEVEAAKRRFAHIDEPNKKELEKVFVMDIPKGELLSDFVKSATDAEFERCCRAITQLEEEMQRLGVNFGSLTSDSIVVGSGGELYPLRHYTMTFHKGAEIAKINCNALRNELEELLRDIKTDECVDFSPLQLTPYSRRESEISRTYLWSDYVYEERRLVHDNGGFGFLNASNEVVIELKYISATRFYEGRAKVETEQGFGTIDTSGRVIVPAIFESLEYNRKSGFSIAKSGNIWHYCHYDGQVKALKEGEYPNIDITHAEFSNL